MKKILSLSLLLITVNFMLIAQIKKDAVLLGGQLSYNNNSNNYLPNQNTQKSTGGNFNIIIGKAFKENTVAGFNVGYSYGKAENFYNGTSFYNSKSNQYNFGLFYRKYKKLGGDFYLFGEAGSNFFTSKQTSSDVSGINKVITDGTGINVILSPGISYNLCKKFQLEIILPGIAGINYTSYKSTPQNNNNKQQQFGISTSLNGSLLNSVGIGFRLIL